MGLSNYLFSGSYLNISRIVYEKNIKHISATLSIFTTDRKQFVTKDYYALNRRKCLGIRVANTPPENPQHEEAYLLKGDLQGVWKNYPNHIASWDKHKKDWNYWLAFSWPDILFLEETQKYARLKDGEFEFCDCYDDERIWNKFFDTEILNESNQLKQFYLYLKNLDEFKDCTHA